MARKSISLRKWNGVANFTDTDREVVQSSEGNANILPDTKSIIAKMKPTILFFAVQLIATGPAVADVYKCRGADGKTIISDTGCYGSSQTTSVRHSEFPTPQQQREALELHARRQQQLNSIEAANTAWRSQPASPSPVPVNPQQPQEGSQASDEEAIRQCIRDVERQGMPERRKVELITACRTAGLNQRASGTGEDAVSNCVRNVERTGATGSQKARQIAICHGGDVPPEPRLVSPSHVGQMPQAVIKNCNGPSCTDQLGNRYTTTYGKTVRSDGKRCYQQGSVMYCD